MPVSRLALEWDIQGMDILIAATATLIRTTGATYRTPMGTIVGRHSIGIAVTEFTIRDITGTIGTGVKRRATEI